ncbi:hypothetical protein CH379_019595 [Leptospira ellisii]|uniref:Uncharacterized protein n=1 Tax=Leptospira ellisii TaxID=2023197 RepID=A0A2N0BLB5_9LEPT|nr:hypothetical protein [Leptospira ellisii]MDV6237836.1 hypothetical protein [Leptospira ellisii]PJZ92590.1 hypothetical protein CH379_12370 [Leptospira ellisii]PKA04770.1 hypothetical protein CH375_09020 [Leptospira ellisii]
MNLEIQNNENALVPKTDGDSERELLVRATYLSQRIQSNLIAFCFDLKEMRDRRLFTRLGFETFKDYLQATMPKFIPISFAKNMLMLSDKMSEEEYSGVDQDQIKTLAKIASDSDVYKITKMGTVHLIDGQELTIEEYESIRAEDIAQNTKTYADALKIVEEHKELTKENQRIGRDLEVNEGVIEKQSDKIKQLSDAIDYIVKEKGTESDLIATVTTKVGATKRIMELLLLIEQAVTEINSIDDTLKSDYDVAGSVLQLETMLKLAGTKINNVWNPFFFAIQEEN